MEKVFIYWDHHNISINAPQVADENDNDTAKSRVCIAPEHLLQLAKAERDLGRAFAASPIPPELRKLWHDLNNAGFKAQWQSRGNAKEELGVDQSLQNAMLRDGFDHWDNPGIAVLISGDGDFHSDLERMHYRGWRIEVLSWRHSCNRRMREWAEANGVFIALDDFYDSVTFLEPPAPGQPLAAPATPPRPTCRNGR